MTALSLRFQPFQEDDGGTAVNHVLGELRVWADHPSFAIDVPDEGTESTGLGHGVSLP